MEKQGRGGLKIIMAQSVKLKDGTYIDASGVWDNVQGKSQESMNEVVLDHTFENDIHYYTEKCGHVVTISLISYVKLTIPANGGIDLKAPIYKSVWYGVPDVDTMYSTRCYMGDLSIAFIAKSNELQLKNQTSSSISTTMLRATLTYLTND